MAFVFEDQQPPQDQAAAQRFVFEEDTPLPESVKSKGILESAVDTFVGAGARVAQGVNESLGGINKAFGLDHSMYDENAAYWDQKAQAAGSDGLPAKIYQGVGAAPAGVAEFVAGPVYAGIKGAAEGYQETGTVAGTLEKAALEVTKRVGVGKVFGAIENTGVSGLTKAAAMGGTMGVQTAAEQAMTPQGVNPQDVAASTITGTLLSVSGGGKSEAVKKALIEGGVHPDIAADLAGRVQDIYTNPGETAGRFQFENQPAKGSISNLTLDPARQSFIKDKVAALGSIETVDRMYPGDTSADQYARQAARELFGDPERGFTMGGSKPVDTRPDLPVTEGEIIPPDTSREASAQVVDGQVVPAGLLPAPERGFVLKPYEGEVIPPERPASAAKTQVVDGEIVPAGLLPAESSKFDARSPNGSAPLSTPSENPEIKPENPPLLSGGASGAEVRSETSKAPLEVTYHPDKRIELSFAEPPTDKKIVSRLKVNRFEDQGAGVWIAKGAGKARREFVDKLQGEFSGKGGNDSLPFSNSGDLQPETNPGAVEQFTATTRKRGGQDVFDVALNPSQRRTLEVVRQEISDGQAGGKVFTERDGQGGTMDVTGYSSSFPDYFRNKGYTKAEALGAIDKILSGDGVTAKQRIMVEDLHQAKRQELTNAILTERAKPAEVSALHLNEGDSLKRNGEQFKVADVSPDGVVLKDGVTMELNHEQVINYDRGTLKDADGKLKRPDGGVTNRDAIPADVALPDARAPRFEASPAGDQGKLFATPPEFGKKPQPTGRATTDELPLAENSIKDREGTQAEMFPHNGGVILDNLGLQQIFEKITNAPLLSEVMADVKALGRHVIAKGASTYAEFFQGMRDTLGKLFPKVRHVMEKLWKQLDNERGSIRIEAPRLRNAWDGLLRAVNPMDRGELAQKAGELLRERMGVREMNRVRFSGELDAAVQKYEEQTGRVAKALDTIQNSGRTLADKVFSKMTEQETRAFMQTMDTGDKAYFAARPELNDIAAVIDRMFQGKVKEIQALGTGAMENVRESYFPHIWEKETDQAQIAKLMGRQPLEGPKSFTRQRVFDDIQAGLDAGYKPISANPLDLVFLKMGEMDKYISAHKGLQAMEESGLVQLVPAGEKAPEGYHDIAGRYGIVTKQAHQDPATGMPGEMKSYRYVAVDEVAQVFNNYLSATLYQNHYIGEIFTGYMGVANHLNQFQLGVGSLFHGGFTSFEAVISRFSLGLKALTSGDLEGAAKYMTTAPAAMVTNWKLGQKVLDAMKSGEAPQGEMADVMDWLQLAGARTGYDERFRTNQTQKVLQAWSNGKHFGAVSRSPLAIVEQSSRVILEHIVPQQKMGVFTEMMKQWVDQHPNATHEELRTAAQQKWSRADARLGQVNYERYFIHNAIKNGLQALIRAPGWTGGTIFELGGGAKDALESVAKLARGEKVELSDRTAYAVSLVVTTAIANGLATLFFTGDMPKGKDFLAFRTGNLDEKGKPERLTWPTYMKDLYSYSQAPGTTLLHKAHPVIGLAGEVIGNQDFYGTEIRHPGDNPAKQVFDTVFHTAKAFTPFWMRGVAKERERGGSALAQVGPFFGVMPAPADMNATAAEKKARELIVGKLPQGSKTKEQFEKSQLEHKLENALRKDDPQARQMIQQAKRDRLITPRDEQSIRKAASTPLIVGLTRSLDFPQALQVWDEATPQERAKLKLPLVEKGQRYIESHPDQEKEINRQIREIRRFVNYGGN